MIQIFYVQSFKFFFTKSNTGNAYVVTQSYDRASMISGHLGDVEAKKCTLRYLHKLHRLNLVIIDMYENINVCI